MFKLIIFRFKCTTENEPIQLKFCNFNIVLGNLLPWDQFTIGSVSNNPVGTSWSNDIKTALFQRYQRLHNVVSTSFDHDVTAGTVFTLKRINI